MTDQLNYLICRNRSEPFEDLSDFCLRGGRHRVVVVVFGVYNTTNLLQKSFKSNSNSQESRSRSFLIFEAAEFVSDRKKGHDD